MTTRTIETVFDTLDEWRHLPKYQLERRADIFFALFLTDVLEKHCSTKFERLVIPEFPLRHGTLETNKGRIGPNQSVNVDYAAFSKDYNKVFFIELKTEMDSRTDKQDSYLKKAAELEFKTLVEGVCLIRKHAKQPKKHAKKYERLLELLSEVPVDAVEHKPQIVYIQPDCAEKNHQDHQNYICFDEFAEVVARRGEIGERFAQSLKCWAKVEAGSHKPH